MKFCFLSCMKIVLMHFLIKKCKQYEKKLKSFTTLLARSKAATSRLKAFLISEKKEPTLKATLFNIKHE